MIQNTSLIEVIEKQNINNAELLNWAIQIRDIQSDQSLSKKEKLKRIKQLNKSTNSYSVILSIIGFVIHSWESSTWGQRLTVIGFTGGLIAFGASPAAGIAAFGTAVGVPLYLVTSAGSAFIGVIIDSLNKK